MIIFQVSHICGKKTISLHKLRRNSLRESRVCWLCIPQQLVVFLLVPDQFTSCVCLLILHSVSYWFLPFLSSNQGIGHTHIDTQRAAMNAKLAEVVQQKVKTSAYMVDFYNALSRVHTLKQVPTQRFLTNRLFFIFLLEYMVCCTVGSVKRPTCRVRQPH